MALYPRKIGALVFCFQTNGTVPHILLSLVGAYSGRHFEHSITVSEPVQSFFKHRSVILKRHRPVYRRCIEHFIGLL